VKKAGGQCPDCRLEMGRMKLKASVDRKREEKERLERIAASAPPAVEDEELEDGVEPDGDPDLDAEQVDSELLAVQTAAARRRGRPMSIKPAHRQPRASGDTRGESWWLKVKPGESMTSAATQELERMANTKEGKKAYRQLSDSVE
jgi:hypothetical protein